TITADKLLLLGKGTFDVDEANDVATLAASIEGPLSYRDVDDLTVGTVGTVSGITSSGFDVKLATTAGALSIEAPVSLGAGDLTLKINGDVSQTSAGGITAAGLQILGSGTVRLDSATNNVTTLAADHTGSISYTDADSLSVGSVTDTAMAMSVSTTGIARGSTGL